jgi:hypothetical protein
MQIISNDVGKLTKAVAKEGIKLAHQESAADSEMFEAEAERQRQAMGSIIDI